MKPTLLVLAAGMGSRYGGLKQIDPVGPAGETVLDYSVYDARRAGFGRVVFVIRRDIEAPFKESVGARFAGKLDVGYAFQELAMVPPGFSVPAERQKPWGTGHAILVARDVVREPFAVINADDFYGADSYRVLARALGTTDADTYCMVGFTLANTLSEHGSVARGICQTDAQDLLAGVEELTAIFKTPTGAENRAAGAVRALSGLEIASMNMWGFTPSIFDHLEREFGAFLSANAGNPKAEFFIPTVVNNLTGRGQARVKVLRTGSSWFGVTYREDKPHVVESIRQLIAAGVYPANLWQA